MVSLLGAARDSERTFRESLLSTATRTEIIDLIETRLDKYKLNRSSIFRVINNAPELHSNSILAQTHGSTIVE